METGLRSKVVIVTGAAAGIGKATAVAFAREGGAVQQIEAICQRLRKCHEGYAQIPAMRG